MTAQLRALVNARLIDGTGAPARERSTVIIDGERIVEVTDDRPLPVTLEVVDLGGATVEKFELEPYAITVLERAVD